RRALEHPAFDRGRPRQPGDRDPNRGVVFADCRNSEGVVMTDRYTDLRAALGAGAASGEWISRKDGRLMNMDGWSTAHEDHTFSAAAPIKAGGEVIAIVVDGRDEFNQEMAELKANADYIAAASPATIGALLADYDRLRGALSWTAATLQHA